MKKKTKASKKSASKSAPKALSKKAGSSAPTAPSNKTGVTPLADRVLVRPLSLDEIEGATTSFGIIIPDTAKEKPEQGVVVAVGPGRRGDDNELIPVAVSVGDRVMFSKYGYDEVKVEGEQYYIVSEQNILAVIKK